jgi:uncharacterized protein YjbI with pentapeptide repeats
MAGGDFSGVKFKDAMMSKVSWPTFLHKFALPTHPVHPYLVSKAPLVLRFRALPLMWQVYAEGAKFDGADLTNAVMDRGNYRKASTAHHTPRAATTSQ